MVWGGELRDEAMNRPHASGEFDSESGKNKSALQSGKKKFATNPTMCGRVNPDIFESDDVKSVPSLSPNNKPIWLHNFKARVGRTCRANFPPLYGACSEDILVQRSLGY